MTPFAIAGIQMHVSAQTENVSAMGHRLDLLMARFPWVQMVVFSELAPFGPLPENAQTFPNGTEHAFQEMAARHGVWLVPGSMFERVEERIYNTASVIDPAGQVVGRYRKMFPFRPYEAGVEAGSEFLVFDVPQVGRFGLSICYDIWFPETTRTLTSLGVEVLLHPVLTGTIERDVELTIARATGAMFQCFVIDINGLGAGGNGRSCIVDPSGTALYQAGEQEELIHWRSTWTRCAASARPGCAAWARPSRASATARSTSRSTTARAFPRTTWPRSGRSPCRSGALAGVSGRPPARVASRPRFGRSPPPPTRRPPRPRARRAGAWRGASSAPDPAKSFAILPTSPLASVASRSRP